MNNETVIITDIYNYTKFLCELFNNVLDICKSGI